jgi:hypothetical protein
VGKTFLIRNVFTEPFNFQLSGVANVGLKQNEYVQKLVNDSVEMDALFV